MTHQEYVEACQRTELKGQPAHLLNVTTGEVGILQVCLFPETPEALLVKIGDEVTTWLLKDVRDISTEL